MESNDLDPRHPKYDERMMCPACEGEGHDMKICPYCCEEEVQHHMDAGAYCSSCGSLEGATRDEYPVCDSCQGTGSVLPNKEKEEKEYKL